MPTYKWVTILIIAIILSHINFRVERALKKRLAKNWQVQTLTYLIVCAVAFILYMGAYLIHRALNIAD